MKGLSVALVLLCLGVPRPALADEPRSLHVEPPDAVVLDEDSDSAIPADPGGAHALPLTTAIPHRWRIQRPHFDTATLTLVYHDGWMVQMAGQAVPITPTTVVRMNKTVTLNVRPAGFRAFMETPKGQHTHIFRVDGKMVRVRGMVQKGAEVIIPHALEPADIILGRSGFWAYRLQIPKGALDSDDPLYPETPIYLQPKYGWFSYWQFDVGFCLAVVGGLAAGGVFMRRLRRPTAPLPTAPPKPPAQALLHSEAGRTYRLGHRLGKGGHGSVYDAVEEGNAEHLAIKMMMEGRLDKPQALARFNRETQLCARLSHPGLVKVLDWGVWVSDKNVDVPFMVMERVIGKSLRQLLDETPGPRPPGVVADWMRDVLEALQVAHQAGVVHRDIKPENLMITPSGHVKVVDFGVARDESEGPITQTGAILGTPRYMSPEHLNAKTSTPTSDLYSLGAVAYELLAGEPPYQGEETWGVISKVLMGQLVPVTDINPDVPAELAAIVTRLMATQPQDRFPDAQAVLDALGRWVTTVSESPTFLDL